MNSDVGAHWVGAWSLEGGGGLRRVRSGARTKLRSRQTQLRRNGGLDGWMDGWMPSPFQIWREHRPYFCLSESIPAHFVLSDFFTQDLT